VVLDGEAMCFTKGMHDFDKLWSNCFDEAVRLCAFDLLELNGEDCRAKPLVEQAVDGVTGLGPASLLLGGRVVVPQSDGVSGVRHGVCSKHQRGTTMDHYAGIDVSLECSSVCVVDTNGKIIREAKVPS
jgi:hypothetical protein